MYKCCILLLACAGLVFGQQLDSGSITVTATRSITLQPDQVVLAVSASTGPEVTLDQVLAGLQSLGLTAGDLLGVGSGAGSTLQWNFRLAVSLSKLGDTIAAVQAVDRLRLAFQVAGVQVSPQLRDSQQCSTADLVSDARAQAQKVADAAGMRVSAVLAVANAPGGAGVISVPTFAARTGDFSGILGLAPFIYVPPGSPVTCSATVKFALGS